MEFKDFKDLSFITKTLKNLTLKPKLTSRCKDKVTRRDEEWFNILDDFFTLK